MTENLKHEFFMRMVLDAAEIAYSKGEVPVAAIVEFEGKVLSKSFNSVESLKDPTAHAEILAISSASTLLGTRYLRKCTLYVNLEPCAMCYGAASWAQLNKIVFGAPDNIRGAFSSSKGNQFSKKEIFGGILEHDSKVLLAKFFAGLRI